MASDSREQQMVLGEYKNDDLDAEVATREFYLSYEKTYYGRFMIMLGFDLIPTFIPRSFEKRRDVFTAPRIFDLNIFERMFVCLDDPGASIVGSIISNLMMVVIVLNLIVGIMFTIDKYRNEVPGSCQHPVCVNDPVKCPGKTVCEPVEAGVLMIIDEACVIIFTIEYGLRAILVWFMKPYNVRLVGVVDKRWDEEEEDRALKDDVPRRADPEYSFWYPPVAYAFLGKNVIDILAVLPFYISLAGSGVSLSYIRVLRLLRILRAFKIRGGGVARVMFRSLVDSIEPLLLLLASSSLVVLVYGSIMFDLESGMYEWRCDWDTGFNGDQSGQCRGGYLRDNIAGTAIEVSPFRSSLLGMYWAVVTMTTVGYGDLYPTSTEGRCLAVLCAFTGLVLISLPISILGNNFSTEYRKYKKALSDEHDYKLAQLQRMRDVVKQKSERKKLLYPSMNKSYKNVLNAHVSGGSGSSSRGDASSEAADKVITYRASQMEETNNYFEALDFQFDETNLPAIVPAHGVNAKKVRSAGVAAGATDDTNSLYEEALLFENTILARSASEAFDKEDVLELLHLVLGKYKATVRENERRGRALKQIHTGFDQMESLMKVMHSLQEAQELSLSAIQQVPVAVSIHGSSKGGDRMPR